MTIYINGKAEASGDGTCERPFRTISEAACIVQPGDEVLVLPGIYREEVVPQTAGTPENRIVFRSAEKGKAVITGAEPVREWTKVEGTVWKCEVPNSIFGNYNPYTTLVEGDWFIASFIAHTGELYLNDKAMYEVTSLEEVKNPVKSDLSWDPDFSVYTWYAVQDEAADTTVLYANFQGYDPRVECVEMNVRCHCFYPEKEGIGYITLSGFTVT